MPRYERLVDDAQTTLNGGINDSTTSITVNDGSVFPSEGDFRAIINNSEVVQVTARSSNTLTVVRGVDGTTAVSASDGVNIRVLMTATQIHNLIDELTAGGYTDRPPHRIQDIDGSDITSTDFTWDNQDSSTITDTSYGGLVLDPDTSGDTTVVRLMHITAPSTPYTLRARVSIGHGYNDGGSDYGGIVLRESSTGKFYFLRLTPNNNIIWQSWTNTDTFSANVNTDSQVSANDMWLRFDDDGTNVTAYMSSNGINWKSIASVSRTAFMSGGPDQIGFAANAGDASSDGFLFYLSSFTTGGTNGVSKREQLVNDASTTLDGGINASVTTVTVDDGSVFPASGNFRVLVDDELMLVTDRSTNDLTVVRGAEGTTADSHSTAAVIRAVVTAGALTQIWDDACPFGPTGQQPMKIMDDSDTVLDSTDFTWVNQGTASVTDQTNGSIVLTVPDESGSQNIRALVRTAPSTPYTVTAHLGHGYGAQSGSAGTYAGVCFRESGTSKIMTLHNLLGDKLRCSDFTNETTFAAHNQEFEGTGHLNNWMRLADDGTDITLSVSVDGEVWKEVFSEARGTFFTTAPDQVGFFGNGLNADGSTADIHLYSWLEA